MRIVAAQQQQNILETQKSSFYLPFSQSSGYLSARGVARGWFSIYAVIQGSSSEIGIYQKWAGLENLALYIWRMSRFACLLLLLLLSL